MSLTPIEISLQRQSQDTTQSGEIFHYFQNAHELVEPPQSIIQETHKEDLI